MVKDSDSGTLEKWTLGLLQIEMVKDSDRGALGKWTLGLAMGVWIVGIGTLVSLLY